MHKSIKKKQIELKSKGDRLIILKQVKKQRIDEQELINQLR